MRRIEFFFDCSSPWTYLAFEGIQASPVFAAAEIVWRPILVGGVFNSINPSVYAARATPVPAKAAWAAKDLADWARLAGLRIGSPPVFPVNSVRAMRGALVADDAGLLLPFCRRVFESYWGELQDIGDEALVVALAAEVGLDPDAFATAIASDEIKARLRANTEELIRRGGFGSPTLFLDGDDMYFGNDRLPLVAAALAAGTGRES